MTVDMSMAAQKRPHAALGEEETGAQVYTDILSDISDKDH
jgi:hypothetical protein